MRGSPVQAFFLASPIPLPSFWRSGRRARLCLGQPLSGLWQELAEELGGRNFILLILGLLAASLYVTVYLVGVNYSGQARIPIDGDTNGDSFRIRL